jgi:hypothetical protein
MLTLKTRSKVAADGTVTIPVGAKEAGMEVDVTIIPVRDITQEEWIALLKRTADVLGDLNLTRPEQPPLEPAPEFD